MGTGQPTQTGIQCRFMSRSITDYSRVHYRVAVYYPGIMLYQGKSNHLLIIDLCVHGCAAEEPHGVPPGSQVQLLIKDPSCSPIPILTAVVRWRHGTRCGLEFVGVPPQSSEQLRRAVIEELGRKHTVEGSA